MEQKQTAVDWIIDKIIENNNMSEIYLSIFDVAEAKAMEEKQIKDAWLSSWKDSMLNPLSDEHYQELADDYYNETYGSK